VDGFPWASWLERDGSGEWPRRRNRTFHTWLACANEYEPPPKRSDDDRFGQISTAGIISAQGLLHECSDRNIDRNDDPGERNRKGAAVGGVAGIGA
jgi:hypothetical protein